MAENEGSGVTGSATLTPGEEGVVVEVTIDSGLAEGVHASHIHTGTCAAQGPIETELSDITADASGGGTATTLEEGVTTELAVLQDGNHFIAVYDRSVGAIVSCGDIPAA
jgi:Cu/Zn superoxide dismutase